MLLRPRVHLRPELRLPTGLRMRERQEEVAAVTVRPGASHESSAPAAAEPLARELLALLAGQRPAFLAFVRRRVRSGADAEDILQQALLKATSSIDTVRDGERLEAWFYRILRNTVADHHAEWARRETRLEVLAREASEAPPEEAAVCACSLGVLGTLRSEYAEILRRVDVDEESLDDAARAVGITPNNAKVRLHRARKALRGALLSFCGTDSARACASCGCD